MQTQALFASSNVVLSRCVVCGGEGYVFKAGIPVSCVACGGRGWVWKSVGSECSEIGTY